MNGHLLHLDINQSGFLFLFGELLNRQVPEREQLLAFQHEEVAFLSLTINFSLQSLKYAIHSQRISRIGAIAADLLYLEPFNVSQELCRRHFIRREAINNLGRLFASSLPFLLLRWHFGCWLLAMKSRWEPELLFVFN